MNFITKLILVLIASGAVGFTAYMIIESTAAPARTPIENPEQAGVTQKSNADETVAPKPKVIFKAKTPRSEQISAPVEADNGSTAPVSENASVLKLKEGYKIPEDAEVTKFMIPEKEIENNMSIDELYVKMSDSDSQFTVDETGKPIVLVTKVAENGLIHKIGFREGDKVRAVNGYAVSNMLDAVSLYSKLKNEKQFSVEIERDGKKIVFMYRIGR